MAKATAAEPTPTELDAVLAGALTAGATLYGMPVRRVWIETDDGQWRKLGLPEPAESTGEDGLSPTRRRIVAALKAEPRPVTRKTLGLRINRNARGGKFGQDVRHLLDQGLIFEGGDLLTDDRKKFAAVV